MADQDKPKKKKRLWQVDHAVYESSRKLGLLGRLLEFSKSLGKILIYIAAIGYPLILPIIGVAFGAIVFWGAFSASVLLVAVLMSKFGYAKNFERRDFPFLTSLLGLFGGFILAAGFYLGLFYLRWFVLPMFAVLGLIIFLLFLRRKS